MKINYYKLYLQELLHNQIREVRFHIRCKHQFILIVCQILNKDK